MPPMLPLIELNDGRAKAVVIFSVLSGVGLTIYQVLESTYNTVDKRRNLWVRRHPRHPPRLWLL